VFLKLIRLSSKSKVENKVLVKNDSKYRKNGIVQVYRKRSTTGNYSLMDGEGL